jgi:hypothetical protein
MIYPGLKEFQKLPLQEYLATLNEFRDNCLQMKWDLQSKKATRRATHAAVKAAKHDWRQAAVAHEQARRELERLDGNRVNFESDFGYAIACAFDVNAEFVSMPKTHDGWWVRIIDGEHDKGAYAALLTHEGQIRLCRRRLDGDRTLPLNEREARECLGSPLSIGLDPKAIQTDSTKLTG